MKKTLVWNVAFQNTSPFALHLCIVRALLRDRIIFQIFAEIPLGCQLFPTVHPSLTFSTKTTKTLEFLVSSRPCSNGCSPDFFPPQKPTLIKFQFDPERTNIFESSSLRVIWYFVGKQMLFMLILYTTGSLICVKRRQVSLLIVKCSLCFVGTAWKRAERKRGAGETRRRRGCWKTTERRRMGKKMFYARLFKALSFSFTLYVKLVLVPRWKDFSVRRSLSRIRRGSLSRLLRLKKSTCMHENDVLLFSEWDKHTRRGNPSAPIRSRT